MKALDVAALQRADDTLSPRALRDAYGCFPTGVAAVCALVNDIPVGMAVSSFTSVSLAPPLVSICVDRLSTTWPALRTAPQLGLSVLSESHQQASSQLSAKTGDRFVNLGFDTTTDGAVLLHEAAAWLQCTVQEELLAGDHLIVVLRIVALLADPEGLPLVFHRSSYHRLIGNDTQLRT